MADDDNAGLNQGDDDNAGLNQGDDENAGLNQGTDAGELLPLIDPSLAGWDETDDVGWFSSIDFNNLDNSLPTPTELENFLLGPSQEMGTSSVGPSLEESSREMLIGQPMTAETNAGQPLPVADPNISVQTGELIGYAKSRWLTVSEVSQILDHSNSFGIEVRKEFVHRPQAGDVIMFDCNVVPHYRRDGYEWKRNSSGKKLLERRLVLKEGDGLRMISAAYGCRLGDESFERRIFRYHNNKDKNKNFALVHYRQVNLVSGQDLMGTSSAGNDDAIQEIRGNQLAPSTEHIFHPFRHLRLKPADSAVLEKICRYHPETFTERHVKDSYVDQTPVVTLTGVVLDFSEQRMEGYSDEESGTFRRRFINLNEQYGFELEWLLNFVDKAQNLAKKDYDRPLHELDEESRGLDSEVARLELEIGRVEERLNQLKEDRMVLVARSKDVADRRAKTREQLVVELGPEDAALVAGRFEEALFPPPRGECQTLSQRRRDAAASARSSDPPTQDPVLQHLLAQAELAEAERSATSDFRLEIRGAIHDLDQRMRAMEARMEMPEGRQDDHDDV